MATDPIPSLPSTDKQVTDEQISTGFAADVSSNATPTWTTARPVDEFLLDFKILEGHNWTDGLLDNTTEEFRNLTSALRNALWEMYGNSSLAGDIDDIIIDGFT
ncbi:Hypp4976 [Branchiostoma lanceolatum]|uniref:Hypp4976 protein n=1 Tax=Branchiostoma lanceolatum TaxID=7740 RepID=A0A8K0ACM7_BRALA|nr:Hypp4976 [Branchiostoma lanceolatum]